jgi:hypothetical protein
MPDRDEEPADVRAEAPADVEIVAGATADALRFHAPPRTATRFPGHGPRTSERRTSRTNLDTPPRPGRVYRRVSVAVRLSSRLADPGPETPPPRS